MLDANELLVTSTDQTFCKTQITTFDEVENSKSYDLEGYYNEIVFEDYTMNAGVNSSSAILQVLRYSGHANEMISGSFLDLSVAWSQFVTGLTVIFVPSNENIVTIIGDIKATYSTIAGTKIPSEIIQAWAPISFYEENFFYVTMSLRKGFYTVLSDGSYIISIFGQKNNATYGFTTAYNVQKPKDLPEAETSTTTAASLRSKTTVETTTVLSDTTTTSIDTTEIIVISTTTISNETKGSINALSNIGLLLSVVLFQLLH